MHLQFRDKRHSLGINRCNEGEVLSVTHFRGHWLSRMVVGGGVFGEDGLGLAFKGSIQQHHNHGFVDAFKIYHPVTGKDLFSWLLQPFQQGPEFGGLFRFTAGIVVVDDPD